MAGNLRLVPNFGESNPDTLFLLSERVADVRNLPDSEHTLLLRCVLTTKAQEASRSLPVSESQSYSSVKAAVFKACELVPEAYRQRFRKVR